jgi:ribosome-associated protein YbcJ (S4-like RNA binding protein)
MNAVVTDPILLALVQSMEVKVNIMDEERKAKELYQRGVVAMQEAYGKEMM